MHFIVFLMSQENLSAFKLQQDSGALEKYLVSDLHEELKLNVYYITSRKMFSSSEQGAVRC